MHAAGNTTHAAPSCCHSFHIESPPSRPCTRRPHQQYQCATAYSGRPASPTKQRLGCTCAEGSVPLFSQCSCCRQAEPGTPVCDINRHQQQCMHAGMLCSLPMQSARPSPGANASTANKQHKQTQTGTKTSTKQTSRAAKAHTHTATIRLVCSGGNSAIQGKETDYRYTRRVLPDTPHKQTCQVAWSRVAWSQSQLLNHHHNRPARLTPLVAARNHQHTRISIERTMRGSTLTTQKAFGVQRKQQRETHTPPLWQRCAQVWTPRCACSPMREAQA